MSGRTLLGTILALLGVGLLLEQTGVLDLGSLLATWWPLLLVGAGALKIASGSRLGGTVILLAGAVFQARALDVLPGEFFDYFWPAVLLVGGVWLIASRGGSEPAVSSEDFLRQLVVLGGLQTRNESQRFSGGELTVLMGGLELDLRDARIQGDRAAIEVTTLMGGAEIRVPKEWRVTSTGTPLLGGWENKTEHRPAKGETSPTLELTGVSLFGGVEIGN